MESPEDFSNRPRGEEEGCSVLVWAVTGVALVCGYILALVILVPAR